MKANDKKTETISVDPKNPDTTAIMRAAEIIRRGGTVAFPTETVYGLGADGFNRDAAKKIYEAKGRPTDNPLIVHIADMDQISLVAREIPERAIRLAGAFWPGPMTLVFKKKPEVPDETTGFLDTVAVRMPAHPVAARLIKMSGTVIAAPSANLSGRPSPTTGKHVIDDLGGRIDMILDSGKASLGLESTIIDVTEEAPVILRPGFITEEMIKRVAGRVRTDPAAGENRPGAEKPKAPGMKYRHYAPKGDFMLFDGEGEAVTAAIAAAAKEKAGEGVRVGIIATAENVSALEKELSQCGGEIAILSVGSGKDLAGVAGNLYDVLRRMDELGAEQIYGETFGREDLGRAVMNRLCKAAGYNITPV